MPDWKFLTQQVTNWIIFGKYKISTWHESNQPTRITTSKFHHNQRNRWIISWPKTPIVLVWKRQRLSFQEWESYIFLMILHNKKTLKHCYIIWYICHIIWYFKFSIFLVPLAILFVELKIQLINFFVFVNVDMKTAVLSFSLTLNALLWLVIWFAYINPVRSFGLS